MEQRKEKRACPYFLVLYLSARTWSKMYVRANSEKRQRKPLRGRTGSHTCVQRLGRQRQRERRKTDPAHIFVVTHVCRGVSPEAGCWTVSKKQIITVQPLPACGQRPFLFLFIYNLATQFPLFFSCMWWPD